MLKLLVYIYLFTGIFLVTAENPCNLKETEDGSVCVCDSNYCDTVPEIADLTFGQYQLYTTSKAKLGFYSTTGSFSNSSDSASVTVTVSDLRSTHQSIIGFGGAFSDAAGITIATLPEAAQEQLLQSYFGKDGIQYSLGRVPIGGTDFSTRPYSYVDEIDETLGTFSLQDEDTQYKIPYILRAIELLDGKPLKLFASAWSAPTWMKTNNWYNGLGTLKDEYWNLWAEYHIKFFDSYSQNGISFWGVTTQNEPIDGFLNTTVQNIGFNSSQMRAWVTKYLGPAIRNSPAHNHLKIILHDDQRLLLPILKLFVLSDDDVIKYADGVGVHWYTDSFIPPSFLNLIRSDKKKLFRLATEATTGYRSISGAEKAVALGSWDRAEQYLDNIIEDLSYDVGGWADGNMVLNETGGPNWINVTVDSPIIVNVTAANGEFYKQPMFYALGHFSKFIVPDSVRVDVDLPKSDELSSLAFVRPDGKLAVTLKNKSDKDVTVNVNILGSTEVFTITANSINTLLYSQ